MTAPAAAAGAIGGATPFAWAGMAASLLGGAARPAGPSSADAIFGGGQFAFDNSNWMVNFGDGATLGITGDRQGPSMSQPQTYDRQPAPVQVPVSYAGQGQAGAGAGVGGGYPIGSPVASGGGVATIAGIPVMWLLIGLGAVVLLKKK